MTNRPVPIQFPTGIKTIGVPTPVDWWSGPYTGSTIAEALTAANAGISAGARFRSMEVRLLVGADTYKYWYYSGTANSDLVPFSPDVSLSASGPQGAIQFNDSGSFSGSNALVYLDTSKLLVLGTNVAVQFSDGTTQGTARNFFGITAATSQRFPSGLSGAGNTGDRLLIATGPSADPFRNYVRFGNQWFQTGVVGIAQGPQGPQGEQGATGSFTGNVVNSLNSLTGNVSLTAGQNVSLSLSGNTITISASGGSAETLWGRTDATTVTVGGVAQGSTFDVATNAIQVLHKMLYPYQSVSFASFSSALASAYEIGQTAGNGAFTATWVASAPAANWVSNSAYIRYSGTAALASGTALTAGSPTAGSASVSYPPFRGTFVGANVSFSLTGQQVSGTPTVTATPSVSTWYSKMYWGKSSNTSLTDPLALTNGVSSPDFVYGGTSRQIQTSSAGGYLYIFLHQSRTLSSIKLGGFDVALENASPTPQSVVNAQGFSSLYKVYRSFFQLPGALTLDIVIT